MESYVKQYEENGIGIIEFFHPNHNALPGRLLKKLTTAFNKAGVNNNLRVIVLKSRGDRTFCAGASFEELINIKDEEAGTKFFTGFANVINAMRKCPKFIVGRIQGKAVGGGVGLAAATDYCLATKFASVKLSELNLGIGPFVVSPAIERKIGLSALSQIALDPSSFYSANWAQQKGLYAQVLDTTEELDVAIRDLTAKLYKYNPEAMKEMKKMFWKNASHWDQLLVERANISGKLVLSKFTKKTLNRFK